MLSMALLVCLRMDNSQTASASLIILIDFIKNTGCALEMLHAFQIVITISVIVDIDECAIGNKGGCHKDARCVNEVGSFRCQCKPGYEGDGKTCQGIPNLIRQN